MTNKMKTLMENFSSFVTEEDGCEPGQKFNMKTGKPCPQDKPGGSVSLKPLMAIRKRNFLVYEKLVELVKIAEPGSDAQELAKVLAGIVGDNEKKLKDYFDSLRALMKEERGNTNETK